VPRFTRRAASASPGDQRCQGAPGATTPAYGGRQPGFCHHTDTPEKQPTTQLMSSRQGALRGSPDPDRVCLVLTAHPDHCPSLSHRPATVRPSVQAPDDHGGPAVAFGLANGHGFAARCGLRFPDGISFDTWSSMGERIATVSNASAWWLGDWLVYGQRRFAGRYKLAIRSTGLEYQTLRNYAWIARRFPLSRRRDTLSFQHHVEVASLSDPAQDLWLDRAVRFGWARSDLRRQMRRTLDPRPAARPASLVVVRMDVTSERQRRWRDAAAQTELPFEDWIAAAADTAAKSALEQEVVDDPVEYGKA
jgi:hypothetical protein